MGEFQEKSNSNLLELAAGDDVIAFRFQVEEMGFDVDEVSLWYGRRIGSNKMGLQERTPLMIASTYGSTQVLKYIIQTNKIDVNRACDSDGVTALHCAAAGGAGSAVDVARLLLESSADVNSLNAHGNRPSDLIARSSMKKKLEILLNGGVLEEEEDQESSEIPLLNTVSSEKKEYPVDISLPDINTGVYGSDEFRMYSFKVKPCSRAYSHDWTECPFVHPGENARRRDPRKYNYTCVPCPEFRKGTCVKADACEYAHGVFESWLHPAQYRTRLCKDEIGCARKVCFFAHKVEELRPLYASTGSAVPSPKSMDMASLSPLASPMSPSSGKLQLQLSGSRLKAAVNARDLELELEMLGLESIRTQQQQRQQLIDDLSNHNSPYGYLKPTNLESVYGSMDSLQSPTSHQIRQNMNQPRPSYPYGFDSSAAVAAAVMNSRSAGFAKRSQSFIDRGAAAGTHRNGFSPVGSPAKSGHMMTDWGSPDGKLEWGYNGGADEMSKLKKSASFGIRSGNGLNPNRVGMGSPNRGEPDVSWVNSLVKDVSSVGAGLYSSEQKNLGANNVHEKIPLWVEQFYMEQEGQMVA
jgi:hypothetical protein